MSKKIFPRILIADALSEVSQYESDQENLMVFPKHVTLLNNNNEGKGTAGLESIQNPFKVTVYLIQDIREIAPMTSGQARVKARK